MHLHDACGFLLNAIYTLRIVLDNLIYSMAQLKMSTFCSYVNLSLPHVKSLESTLISVANQLILSISRHPWTVVVVIVWQLDLQLPVQSVPVTTKVVSSNPVYDEVYSIQHYGMKLVSDLRQVGGFLRVLRFLHQ